MCLYVPIKISLVKTIDGDQQHVLDVDAVLLRGRWLLGENGLSSSYGGGNEQTERSSLETHGLSSN